MHDVDDKYLTIKTKAKGFFKDRNSKFLSFIYPVSTEIEIKNIQRELRKTYHDARHHCFAWKLGTDNNNYRINDDGEPSNSAGQPIYGQILSNNLTNVLIVVVRYFGGTKLGIPGLINAYKNSAADAVKNAEIVERYVCDNYLIRVGFENMNSIMKIVKAYNLKILSQDYDSAYTLNIEVRKSIAANIVAKINTIKGASIQCLTDKIL